MSEVINTGFKIEKDLLELFDDLCKKSGSNRSVEIRKLIYTTLEKAGKLPEGYKLSLNALQN